MVIGDHLDVSDSLYVRVVEATSLHIGDGCLIAGDIIIRAIDGYPIYGLMNGEHINKGIIVIIERHVWLGGLF